MKETIAIFDFDNTITSKDTFNDIIIYHFGITRWLFFFLKNTHLVILYILHKIPNRLLKEKMFANFFKGLDTIDYTKLCSDYSSNRLQNIICKKAMDKINWHIQNKHKVIVISASMYDWILPWAKENNINDVIATVAEYDSNVLTGRFQSENCYGPEKLKRFKEKYPNLDNYFIYAYGDSRGDKEILDYADKKFYREF